MVTHSLTHWRTTIAGVIAGAFIALQNLPDLDTMSWRQIGIRFAVALSVSAFGALSADGRQNPGVVVEPPK